MNKITIVVSSKKSREENEGFIKHVVKSSKVECDVLHFQNNGEKSLTEIYQEGLDKSSTEMVVFMHDDITFMRDGWGEVLFDLFEKNKEYGIIGVAGSGDFEFNAAWWQYKDIYGQVMHKKDNSVWLTEFSKDLGDDLAEVCVVDGLFFAVMKDRINNGFDTSIEGFNFYEIDFCLSNFLSKNTKIGVTTKIKILHNSIGEMKPNWYANRNVINEKYKEYYPIKIRNNEEEKRKGFKRRR